MAGEGDAERLVVLLEARIRDFERNMAKASGSAKRSYAEITAGSSRASKTLAQNMADGAAKASTSLASFGKGFVGGLAAGAVAEFTNAIRGAVTSVAELKSQSQQAGVGVEAFQRLDEAARQAKVGTDALVDGLKEMQLRIDEFVVTGGGSASESLKRLGYDAATLKAGLADVPALFLDILGRIQQLDQAARIRVLDELFGGTGGEQFIRLVDMGADKVRRIGDEADAAGRVIETALVDRAALLDAQWSLMATTIRTEVVAAILEASRVMGPLIEQSNALGTSFDRFMKSPSWLNFNAFMVGGMVEKEAQRVNRLTAPPTAADDARENARARTFQDRTSAPKGTVEDRLTRARPSDAPPVPQTNLPPTPYRPPNLLDYDPNAGSGGGGGGGGGGAAARSAAAGAVRTERDAVEELIKSLEAELELVGKSDEEREVANNLRRAGADATEAEKAKIAELTAALGEQEKAYRASADAVEEFQGIGADAFKGLISDLRSGASLSDALADALGRLGDKFADLAIDALTSKGGGLGGIVGALLGAFGGGLGGSLPSVAAAGTGALYGLSEGGYTGPGGKYKPAGIVHAGEVVFSQSDVAAHGGVAAVEGFRRSRGGYADGGAVAPAPSAGGGRGKRPSAAAGPVAITIDVRGATGNSEIQGMVQAGIRQGIAAYDKSLADGRVLAQRVGNAQMRFGR